MANRIVLKRSSVALKVPLAGDLVAGELAVNLTDKVLYTKDASGNVVPLGGSGGGSGTVTGVTATAPVVSSGGAAPVISMAAANTSTPGYLTAADWNTFNGKQAALGFTPYNATNPSGYISGITSANVTTALGYTPYNATNPNGYISNITSANVTTALGYTPYNNSNPSGYITSSASISGNAATATNSTQLGGFSKDYFVYGDSSNTGSVNTYIPEGGVGANAISRSCFFRDNTSNFTALGIHIQHAANSGYAVQIGCDYAASTWQVRAKQSGTWGSSATLLTSGNYTSYSPSLTGSGASGTWGINVTGSAGSAGSATWAANVYLNSSSSYLIGGSVWAGAGGYPGYQFSGGNGRFGFSSTGGNVDVYADGNFYSTDSARLNLYEDTWLNNKHFGSDGNIYSNASMRAPIFYDQNDTAFYADSNSTSVFNVLNVNTINAKNSAGRIIMTGNLHIDAFLGNDIYLNYYASARTRAYVNAVEKFRVDTDGIVYAFDQFRSPVFYDNNDTAYSLDANGTSYLNVTGTNKIRADSNRNFGDSNQGWWTHDPYGYGWGKPHGSFRTLEVSSSGNFSTEPALFRMHQWGSGAAEFWKPQGTTLYLRETPGGGGGWFTRFYLEGYGESNQSWRAPQFFDSNDTAYYLDPNGTSELSTLTAATRTRWDMPRRTFNRQAYTGGTGYWTGTRGWGEAINWNQAWGYGFGGFDIWGNNTQHPQGNGYIHAQGICSGLHHVSDDGSNAYGFQLVGGTNASDRLWYRGAWGNSGNNWREIPMFDVNSGNGSWMWFAGWYDNNNSGYYVDPNGTSRMGTINADTLNSYGTIAAYYSDDRLKTRFNNIGGALDMVCSLNGFFYEANETAEKLGYKKKREVGLSAQEVQRILPEIISPAPIDEQYMTIQYDRVVPLLVEAIKELRLELKQLKSLVKL